MTEQEIRVVVLMNYYGGSFVKALSECFARADRINFIKLKNTFSEYWDEYEKMSLKMKKNGSSKHS